MWVEINEIMNDIVVEVKPDNLSGLPIQRRVYLYSPFMSNSMFICQNVIKLFGK
jgi:hypothetical protein